MRVEALQGQELYAHLLAADKRLQSARWYVDWARERFESFPSNVTHDQVRDAHDEFFFATAYAQEVGLPNAPATDEWAQHSRRVEL